MSKRHSLKLRARLMHGDDIAMGPGKADLLDAIDQTGSISAAARSMGMSYRRAWLLVDTMNRCFTSPLVSSSPGGSHGGGAQLTDQGREILAQYRQWQAELETASARHFAALEKKLKR